MMVAAFNPKTKTATIISVPRDSDLGLKGYKKHKVNAFYASFLAQGRAQKLDKDATVAFARDETRRMMSKFFDAPIDYTAVIDFQGFIDVVNALGGVDVNVDQDMKYADSADGTNIDLKKGQQVLQGEDALGFVRYRKSKHNETRQSSDFERNDRQSRVLGAIVEKLKTIGGITKVDGILNSVGDNMTTDIPENQVTNLIETYFGISRDHIRFIPLEGTWKSPYVYLDEARVLEAKQALAEELRPEGRSLAIPTPSAASSASAISN
jgi:LCP family protein required for cell wall assembly